MGTAVVDVAGVFVVPPAFCTSDPSFCGEGLGIGFNCTAIQLLFFLAEFGSDGVHVEAEFPIGHDLHMTLRVNPDKNTAVFVCPCPLRHLSVVALDPGDEYGLTPKVEPSLLGIRPLARTEVEVVLFPPLGFEQQPRGAFEFRGFGRLRHERAVENRCQVERLKLPVTTYALSFFAEVLHGGVTLVPDKRTLRADPVEELASFHGLPSVVFCWKRLAKVLFLQFLLQEKLRNLPELLVIPRVLEMIALQETGQLERLTGRCTVDTIDVLQDVFHTPVFPEVDAEFLDDESRGGPCFAHILPRVFVEDTATDANQDIAFGLVSVWQGNPCRNEEDGGGLDAWEHFFPKHAEKNHCKDLVDMKPGMGYDTQTIGHLASLVGTVTNMRVSPSLK